MPAGRITDGADAVGIDVIFFGIEPHPADGGFGIVNGGWELEFGREAIGNRHRDIATARQFFAERIPAGAIAGAKTSAMNADNRGEWSRILGDFPGPGEVELKMLIIRVGVFDVGFEQNLATKRRRSEQQDQEN